MAKYNALMKAKSAGIEINVTYRKQTAGEIWHQRRSGGSMKTGEMKAIWRRWLMRKHQLKAAEIASKMA
jgi:hypothetical protein